MSKTKVTVGIVGAGTISQQLHIPVLLSMPNVAVRWIADENEIRVKSVGAAYKIPALVTNQPDVKLDCDVALIAIPTGVREKYYEDFARRGIAVFAEKTLALTAQEHRRICSMFPLHKLGCGYLRRSYGTVRAIAALARYSTFGRLLAIRGFEGERTARTRVDNSYIDDRRQSGGGVLAAIGCHIIDAAMFITEADSFGILARSAVFDGDIDRRFGARVMLIRKRSAAIEVELEFCVSWLDRQANTISAEFERAEVTASAGPGNRLSIRTSNGEKVPVSMAYEGVSALTANQACFLEWAAFLEGLQSGQPSHFSGAASLHTAELIDLLYTDMRSS